MRFGLIARGDDRGLGQITWEAHRNLHPDRTLLIDLGDLSAGFPVHPERYADADRETLWVAWDGAPLDAGAEELVRQWLDGLDVVLSVETFYDWRILDWAREAGCATVLLTMPEFWRCGTGGVPMPDAVWAPTPWRLDCLPESTRLVPVPVALDRLTPSEPTGGPLRVLHVAGHRAAADRNGTQIVLRAAQRLRERVDITVAGQDRRLPSGHVRRGGPVTLTTRPGGVADYWELYRGQDILVMPRRYGGLSLPVQEGMAAGLVPVMPDVSPNEAWPAVLVNARFVGTIATQGGVLRKAQVAPADLAAAVDALARDRDLLALRRSLALEWARAHSWEALGPLWLAELERAR